MPKTVLVADESVTIRSVAESLLRGESFSVHSAADGQLAFELAVAEKPDLILLGEKLTGRSGVEVCNDIKTHADLKDTPVIYMRTDRPGPEPDQADAVLTKPFSPQALLDAVHRFVASGRAPESRPSFQPVQDSGLEDELIDQALGLDDVGPTPAEEREVTAPTGPVKSHEDSDAEDSPVLGLVDELKDAEDSDNPEDEDAIGSVSVDADHLDSADTVNPPAAGKPGGGTELDRALDLALGDSVEPFGDRPAASAQAPSGQVPKPAANASDAIDSSSLQEISLSDSDRAPETPAAPRSPHEGIDLGGTDEPPASERPHDYDWFINEMARETSAKSPAKPAPEPPSIEPVQPAAPATPPPPGLPRESNTSSQIQIDGVEELDESRRGYDQFINEFRKEIAKLEGMAPTPEATGAPGAPAEGEGSEPDHSSSGQVSLDDSRPDRLPPPVPATTDSRLRNMSDELINEVTAQVARELAAKIDSKMIYALIQEKLKKSSGDSQP